MSKSRIVGLFLLGTVWIAVVAALMIDMAFNTFAACLKDGGAAIASSVSAGAAPSETPRSLACSTVAVFDGWVPGHPAQ